MHNGFVRVDNEKMSKSLGNFFTVREVLTRYRPEEVRFSFCASHYRSPLNYTEDNLDQARAALARLYTALRGLGATTQADEEYQLRFNAAMDDDFNSAEALSVLFSLANDCNRARAADADRAARLAATLRRLGGLLGILQDDPDSYLQGVPSAGTESAGPNAAEIEALIAQRLAARQAKNWAESDRIRDLLKEQGVLLEDAAHGTTWRRQ